MTAPDSPSHSSSSPSTATASRGVSKGNGRVNRASGLRNMSLRSRLATLTAFVVIGSILIITVAAYATVSTVMYREQDRSLQSQAQLLSKDGFPEDFVRRVENTPGDFEPSFEITSRVAQALIIPARYTGSAMDESLYQKQLGPELMQVIRGNAPFAFEDRGEYRMYAVREADGTVIVVRQKSTPMKTSIARLQIVLATLAIIGSLGAIVTAFAVAGAGIRPINRLRKAVDRVTETGELRQIPVHTGDEVGALTVSYNGMMRALQSAETKQRNLVADASHELKTPLTSMRTNVELLMQLNKPGAPKIDEADVRALEADVIGQIDEMSSLIGDLVDLAREDSSGTDSAPVEDVELDEVISTVLERVQRRRPDVTFDMNTIPWTIRGDQFMLSRALTNLLDNAAKWSPTDGVVRVWMNTVSKPGLQAKDGSANDDPQMGGTVEIRIADSGPGIPKEDRLHVFDRFYRSIQARSMPGSGLGLAIVKQVIDKHGGQIVADESDDGGALMRVLLPGRPT